VDQPAATALAKGIVDANLYMVLATTGADGAPWASPVYFAHVGYRGFVWVSEPEARHSQNIAARGEVGIVIFDSSAAIGTGCGVYMTATAGEAGPDDAPGALEAYSRRSRSHGGEAWTLADVRAPARLRLYRAAVSEHYVLDEHDERVPVSLGEVD
jgi:hypothetical protein